MRVVAELFHSTTYEDEVMLFLLSACRKRLVSQFNFTYRYIDDVFYINIPKFENYPVLIYPPDIEIKDTTESNICASAWIYSCQWVGSISFALPFTTSVTIPMS